MLRNLREIVIYAVLSRQRETKLHSTDGYYSTLYDAFGGQRGAVTSRSGFALVNQDPVGWCGQWGGYTDQETVTPPGAGTDPLVRYPLVLLGHRYYDPGAGRFLNRDPVGMEGGVNVYAYCTNNPVNLCDPSGLVTIPFEDYFKSLMSQGSSSPKVVKIRSGGLGPFHMGGGGGLGGSGIIAIPFAMGNAAIKFSAQGEFILTNNIGTFDDRMAIFACENNQYRWSRRVEFSGVRIYQRPGLYAATPQNLGRMRKGFAPYSTSGQKVILHHMLQTNESALIEVPMNMHQRYTHILHINWPKEDFGKIDRPPFDDFREAYWEARGQELEAQLRGAK